ncbi:pre-terminal protein [Psittacine adenovirus 1]|uniref:Pre-terminal protein n=1 Tax=Psittacine adenovirus 1 TaxID=318592 RepID=A0A2Z5E051_9ADEN|nr:pre-terminal protein [Psittacine adenovirus 1]AXB73033.1 pre-terminal protein [Psittacine adenovirus 1]
MQLRDLAPGSPNVAGPPYEGLPPPHFLLGYQYMHRTLNDYLFENRVFMQLGYESPPTQRPRRLFWTCLTDCSYTVNVGQYMRFLDLENFHDSFQQMHNAVLMDRVAADMGRVHLRGRGIDVGARGEVLDPEQFPMDAENDNRRHSFLSGRGASGLSDDVVQRLSSAADADTLAAIRRLRVALCHYLFCQYYDNFRTERTISFLPGSDVFADIDWLSLFVETFADLDTQTLVRQPGVRGDPFDEPAEVMARCFLSSLAATDNPNAAEEAIQLLRGGMQLRNRRVPAREGLRPRNRQGQAITASQLTARRRRAVQRFIDRLPPTRRRRRPRAPSPPPPAPEEEEEEFMEELEEPFVPIEPEEEEEAFLDEIIRTALEAINALQEELSGPARRHELFRFGTDFYRLLLQSRDAGIVTESFLRKWVLYFFLAEHIASTLYYLYSHFVAHREFRRYVDVTMLQVVLTGWDVNAQQIFKRLWSEQSNPATIFETIWQRVLRDFLMMVERTGQFQGMDELDQHLFLSDIQYRDRSGDVEEVLKQLNLSEELLDSIDLSFRIKFRGIVAINTNQRIRVQLLRVLRHRQENLELQLQRRP